MDGTYSAIQHTSYKLWDVDGTFSCVCKYIYVRVYKGRDLLVGCVLVEIVDEMKGKKML